MVKTKNSSPTQPTSPSDQLDLRPGQSIELLKALHILTREGKLNQDSRRKLKQVKHLFQFIEKPLMEMLTQRLAQGNTAPITLADHGAGKSYLGFMIHDLFFKPQQLVHGRSVGQVIGIETRLDLVAASQQLAQQLGFAEGMQFVNASVSQAATDESLPEQIDMVTALHACDTATDHAIHYGIRGGAAIICCAPCCHKQLRPQLLQPHPLRPILQHGVHLGQEAEMLTDGLRALLLDACGDDTQVFEFVSLEHTSKNKMLLAVKRPQPLTAARRSELLQQIAGIKQFYGIRQQELETLLASA